MAKEPTPELRLGPAPLDRGGAHLARQVPDPLLDAADASKEGAPTGGPLLLPIRQLSPVLRRDLSPARWPPAKGLRFESNGVINSPTPDSAVPAAWRKNEVSSQ